MKKVLIVLGAVVGLVIIAAVALPIIYKDDIKAKVDAEIAKSVNAKVFYDADKFGISMFSNFPHFTLSAGDFGIVGKGDFEGDTLTSIKKFSVVVDLMSVIKGDKIKINKIDLDSPRIFGKILPNGKANWDIAIADTTAPKTPTDTAQSKFAIQIEKWEIDNGYIKYTDKVGNTYAEIVNLNHSGSGDLTQDIFDITTKTSIEALSVEFGGTQYFKKNRFEAELNVNVNNKENKYTFKENEFEINDFAFGFEGSVAMPDSLTTDLDIKFGAKKTEFKNIISLIPGIFLKGYEDLKTEGTIAFDGYAKGRMKGEQLPAYGFNLKIDKGFLQYPQLPTAVKNVLVDLSINNPDGVMDHISVNLKKFHAELGNNPIDAKILLEGIAKAKVDANINAKLNLAEITSIFPVEGTTLKGTFSLNASAKGVYDTLTKQMPAVSAQMALTNGYAKSKDLPAALENISFNATASDASGAFKDFKLLVDKFSFALDKETFAGTLQAENLDDIKYFMKVNGVVDLDKMTKIFPLEGMKLGGKINVQNFETQGVMSDVTAGKYGNLKSSGNMNFQNFSYSSVDLVQGMKVTSGNFNFSPDKMNIVNMVGFLGKSDVVINGYIQNYIPYLFSTGTVKGKMNMQSKVFDVNEWMAEDTTQKAAPTESTPMAIIPVPKNIDFVMESDFKAVKYDKMDIQNLKGQIIVKDGTVKMNNVIFGLMGGNFKTNGTYDTKDLAKPLFDFDLQIDKMQFKDAYTTFSTVKAFAPIAEKLEGFFNTKFKLSGGLTQQMMPDLATLSGDGIVNIAQAAVKGTTLGNGLSSFTKVQSISDMTLKDVLVNFKIENGRVSFKPFDVNAGATKLNLGGSQGLDGSLAYLLKMDIPAGAAGAAASTALSGLTGKTIAPANRIKLNFNVGGTSDKPKFTPAGGETASATQAVKTAVVDKAKAEIDAKKQQAEAQAKVLEAQAKQKANEEAARLKAEADAKANQEKQKLEQKAKDEANKLKKKFGF